MSNRICGNCRHFQKISGGSAGHCTNPLVVSHQGGLVMYREAEIGCRRGWKQDLWEPAGDLPETPDVQDDRMVAEPDFDRAATWADQSPRKPLQVDPIDLKDDRPMLSDDDLLNPRGTRNIREAMRRAREARKRELNAASRRDPSDQPTFTHEGAAGEDSVIDERPIPFDRPRQPIVPPVSLEEVRKHVDDARRRDRNFESAVNISFNEDDERFSAVPERFEQPVEPAPSVEREGPIELPVDEPIVAESSGHEEPPRFPPAGWDDQLLDDEGEERSIAANLATPEGDEYDDWEIQNEAGGGETIWSQQAPWAGDDVLLDPMPQPKPRRRGLLGSILHRREAAARGELSREDELRAWEPDNAWRESAPWPDEQPGVYAEPAYAAEPVEQIIAPRAGDPAQLPPFPYDTDEESGEDYLLADSTFGEREDDDAAIARMPRICETCRYLRPGPNGPTCGAVYAQTYRRIVDLEQLSCASSIGAWWLPSDQYWESRVDISHHGEPTPLLEHYAIQLEERADDDDLHTT